MKRTTVSERALVLAPRGRDGQIAAAMLRECGIDADICPSLEALMEGLNGGAGFVVVTEEAIANADIRELARWISEQEEWSDLPLVLLTQRGGGLERNPEARRRLEVLGNVTFLERPFHPTTLVSLAQSALRGRRRQYEARARLIALKESEARYRALFDTMDEGFCVLRFLDGPEGQMSNYVHVDANAAYERHSGVANVVGKTVRELAPEDADSWIDLYRQVLVTGRPIRFERELADSGRHLELAAFRVDPPSRREVAVLFQDVSTRKRAERQLRELNETLERRISEAVAERQAAIAQLHEAQKLETLGQLTGGVAHDINNLLMPIIGALDLLTRQYAADDARAARLLDGALQSADRAKILVSRLLGFARRQALETRAIDVGELLEGMRDLVSSSIGSRIELRISAVPQLPAALADPNQLELAILNLCVNARDAMREGGALAITAEPARVEPGADADLRPGAFVKLSVIDNGMGMDPDTLARAVEPFFSTKEVGKGTGLGLSMVHGLMAQLGGAFHLSSRPGEGTRAELYLPSAGGPAQALAGHQGQELEVTRPLTVLLVDDEDLVRSGTAEMLRSMGHAVIEASGGGEALARLETGARPDVVITDYIMPRMGGAELAERLRKRAPGLPVLVITGYAGGDLTLSLPHLAKPFRQSDLARALHKLVHGAAGPAPVPADEGAAG